MLSPLRRALALVFALVFLAAPVAANSEEESSAGAPAPAWVDAFLLRPIGLVGFVVSVGVATVSTVFVVLTRPTEIALPWTDIAGPAARYVFVDPLGTH